MSAIGKCATLALMSYVLAMPTDTAAVAVTWTVDANGNWQDAANWSSNPGLPGAADNAIVNVAGVRTVTHGSGADTIQHLMCFEHLAITGGSLAVTGSAMFGKGPTGVPTSGVNLSASGAGSSFAAVTGSANVDNCNLSASAGGTLDLRAAAGYAPGHSGVFDTRTVQASGGGSLVNLSNATSVSFNSGGILAYTDIKALAGGKVDLGAATTVTSSAGGIFNFTRGIRISADGASSTVDLSRLVSFSNNQHPAGADSSLIATNGGRIISPRLAQLNNIKTVTIDGVASSIGTGMLNTFSQGTLTLSNGATTNLDNLVNVDGAGFIVNGGVTLNVNGVLAVANTSPIFTVVTYRANGASSVLNMNGLASYANSGQQAQTTNIEALAGGTLNMTALTSLYAPVGIVNADDPIHVKAQGAGSVVNLTSLATFTDAASATSSSLSASDCGTVNLRASGTTKLTNVAVNVATGGRITGDVVELVSMGTTGIYGGPDETRLSGSGTVAASVLNTSGVVAPGASAGTLLIEGDYEQQHSGDLEVEIFGTGAGQLDVLDVTGTADLGGILRVTLDPGYTPTAGDRFVILTADGGVLNGFDYEYLPTLSGGLEMFVQINPHDVTLLVGIPEPATLGLLLLGGAGASLLRRRRRRNPAL